MKRFFVLGLLVLMPAISGLYGQMYPFRTYSIEDGLSQSVVNAIIQDHEEYIWLGTSFGLSRFDGIEFQNYYVEHGLADNKIYSLFEDSRQRLWIGSAKGLNYWKADSVYYDDRLSALDNLRVISIYEDSVGDIWFGTEFNGVWVLSKTGELEQYSVARGFSSNYIEKIIETADGTMWFATQNGLTRLQYGNIHTYDTDDGLPSLRIRDIAVDKEGILWLATADGLVRFNDGVFTLFGSKSGLNNLSIHAITFDLSDRLWVGTEGGVSLFEHSRFRNFTTGNGLSNGVIYSAHTDHEGNLWFGTFGGGINLFLGDYLENFTTETGLPSNVVTAFTGDNSGRLWVGTYGGGVSIFQDSVFETIGTAQGLLDDKVFTLTHDSKNRIWVGMNDGLSVIQGKSIRNFSEKEFPYQKIRHVYEAGAGNFWISTYGQGIIKYDGRSFTQYTSDDGLAENTVLGAIEDTDRNLWIATYGGVSKLKNGLFENYTTQDGLPSNGVMTIIRDNKGRIWVSTFAGIARFNGERFESITVDDGLPDRMCYFIKQTPDGEFWIGTNNGLVRFDADKYYSEIPDERNEAFRIISREQGLISDEMNVGAVYVDAENHLWIGSVDGMSRFFPGKFHSSRVSPKVKIDRAVVSGRVYKDMNRLRLRYDQNFVEIYFTAINYSAPSRVLYQFKMEGIDPVWQQTNERNAKYPSMPAGEYTFRVLAKSANGTWSNEITRLKFKILAPFWQQWWFILLMVLTVAGIIYLFYLNYKTAKQVDIERMRVRIASDLHDDVGASLTEIALQTDFLQAVDTNPELRKSLSAIGTQSRKIVNSLDDIVWSIDSRNDTVGDLTDRMQDYIFKVLEPKNFMVEYNFEALKMQEKLSVVLKENLYLMFKEAVNNISKYSNGNLVRISMQTEGNNFIFVIADNGTSGNAGKKTGHGLRNLELRAERIGAEVDIDRENGFTITIKGKLTIK